MKILVTGGAGFIGSHVVDALVGQGHVVQVVDNLISSTTQFLQAHLTSGAVEFHQHDIRDLPFLLNHFTNLDVIYHLAADPSVKDSVQDPIESFDVNVRGTMNILELMRVNDIPRLVFTSSGGTLYGEPETFPTPETEPLHPISPYGASKAAGEMYLSAYADAYGLKISSARYANIFGPRSNHGVMYDFFQKLSANPTRLVILGDGSQEKSYLYVTDCVSATLRLGEYLDAQKHPYTFFNVGSPETVTVTEIARLMVDILGLDDATFEYTGGSRGWVGDVRKNFLAIEKLQRLGWAPRYTFREGLELYIRSLQAE